MHCKQPILIYLSAIDCFHFSQSWLYDVKSKKNREHVRVIRTWRCGYTEICVDIFFNKWANYLSIKSILSQTLCSKAYLRSIQDISLPGNHEATKRLISKGKIREMFLLSVDITRAKLPIDENGNFAISSKHLIGREELFIC